MMTKINNFVILFALNIKWFKQLMGAPSVLQGFEIFALLLN